MTWEEIIETWNYLFPFLQKRDFFAMHNEEGSLFRPVILAIFIFFWVCALIWVAKDISVRSKSFWVYLISLLAVLIGTPFFWIIFYLAMRPKKLLEDTLPRKQAVNLTAVPCRNCEELNLTSNRYCTACGEKMKVKCHECWKEISVVYGYCPFCWAPNIE